MELESVFEAAFANVVASGQIEKHVEDVLGKTIKSIIEDKLRSYSDFGKQIEEAVTKSLQIGDLTLPIYGERVAQLIRQITDKQIEATFQQSLTSRLEELLVGAPREITLSKLCEEFSDQFDVHEDHGLTWSFHFVQTHPRIDSLRHLWTLCFDENEGVKAENCDIQLRLEKDRKSEDRYAFHGLTVGCNDVNERLFFGPEYRFARTCWQMYAAKTVLVFDVMPDYISTYIGND